MGKGFLRELRRTATFGALRLGQTIACGADSPAVVEAMRKVLLAAARLSIPLRTRLATNMKCVAMYRPGLTMAYFERAIDQMAMLAHVFRTGRFAASGCPERFQFDESFCVLEQAYSLHKGVINIAPHICGYPLYPPIVSPRIPCSIYMRRNKDPRKRRINEAIGLAGQGHLVYPLEGATKDQKLRVALDVLREGRMLFVTPDTPRKAHQGVGVSIFGRTVFFPTGVFVMSLRTGAPVVPVFWHWDGGTYHIRCEEPFELTRSGRLKQQCEAAVKHWAGMVDRFLRRHPEMWWNWLDKRWTKILRTGS